MPDIHSIGLGGGSRVRYDPDNSTTVGPDSVGHAITARALVFGGPELTATDLAVAAGLAPTIGDSTLVRHLDPTTVKAGQATIRRMLESAIDKVKTDAEDVDVLLVGGGSVIVPDDLRGVKRVFRPPHYGVANAVGAAIARVSGTVDRVEVPGSREMRDIVEECKKDAVDDAVGAGAKRDTVFIAEVSVIQLPVRDLRPVFRVKTPCNILSLLEFGSTWLMQRHASSYEP
jgi:N-methylhydantoinase A/oxoprolinase/acetone carboxylase beta subunit